MSLKHWKFGGVKVYVALLLCSVTCNIRRCVGKTPPQLTKYKRVLKTVHTFGCTKDLGFNFGGALLRESRSWGGVGTYDTYTEYALAYESPRGF